MLPTSATVEETGNISSKITFANQLRGIAVLCVVVSHYFGIYWGARELVAQYTFAPVTTDAVYFYMRHITFPTLNYGPFGVALFFLISGFVIPFSLEKMGRVRFLAARAMRIFPSYWLAIVLMLFGMFLSSRYWGLPFRVEWSQLGSNLLLVNAELAKPSIDTVNWTLSVEIKFYILAVLMWPAIRRASVWSLVAFSALFLGALMVWPPGWNSVTLFGTYVSIDYAKTECMSCCYLFIGTLFHFAVRKQISPLMLTIGVMIMYALFVMMWPHTIVAEQYWRVPANYGYALVVFGTCYAVRSRFRPVRVLDFFAAISYPLYLVHALIGYALIHVLMDQGLPFLVAAALAFLCVTGLATILHYLIEMPTANAGKALGKKATARIPP